MPAVTGKGGLEGTGVRPKGMLKFTQYYLATRHRPERIMIREEWVEDVVRRPLKTFVQADGRIQLWGRVEEEKGRFLRVILLDDGETVHNAFFDRRFKEG